MNFRGTVRNRRATAYRASWYGACNSLSRTAATPVDPGSAEEVAMLRHPVKSSLRMAAWVGFLLVAPAAGSVLVSALLWSLS